MLKQSLPLWPGLARRHVTKGDSRINNHDWADNKIALALHLCGIKPFLEEKLISEIYQEISSTELIHYVSLRFQFQQTLLKKREDLGNLFKHLGSMRFNWGVSLMLVISVAVIALRI